MSEDPPTGPRWLRPRRERIAEAIRLNREGNHPVPTWALAVILLLMLTGIAALVVFA